MHIFKLGNKVKVGFLAEMWQRCEETQKNEGKERHLEYFSQTIFVLFILPPTLDKVEKLLGMTPLNLSKATILLRNQIIFIFINLQIDFRYVKDIFKN